MSEGEHVIITPEKGNVVTYEHCNGDVTDSVTQRSIGYKRKLRDSNGLVVSRMTKYQRSGNLLVGDNKERKQRNSNTKLLKDLDEHVPDLGKVVTRSDPTNEETQVKIENLILELFPNSDWAKNIEKMGEDIIQDIPFKPMTIEMYRTIFWVLTFDKGVPVAVPSSKDKGETVAVLDTEGNIVTGRGNSYKTMTKVVSCIRRMHNQAGLKGPTEMTEGKLLLQDMFNKYSPGGAPTVDPVDLLPSMYNIIQFATYKKTKKSGRDVLHTPLRVSRDWLMFLLMWQIFARPSEIYKFCPSVDSIRIPRDVPMCADGIPPYLLLDLLQWKNRSIAKGKYQMKLNRNFLNAKFCPVFWTLYWLALSGIQSGPIITRLNTKDQSAPIASSKQMHKEGYHCFFTVDEEPVEIPLKTMESTIVNSFHEIGYATATMYTIRKSATVWGARCGAKEYALLATGRWRSNSNHFQTYVQAGCTDADRYPAGTDDPIRKIWVFHETIESINTRPIRHEDVEHIDDNKERSRSNFQGKGLKCIHDDVRELLSNFNKEFVEPFDRPDAARVAFEKRMLKYGITLDIDTHGLQGTANTKLTVRPPLEEMVVFKHMFKDIVVQAYGLQKHRLLDNPLWVKIPKVLTIGLSDEVDNIDDILAEELAGETDDRVIPAITDRAFGQLTSFSSREAIIEFFLAGNDDYKPAISWKDSILAAKEDCISGDAYRNYKQHYTGLCLQYIYAVKCKGDKFIPFKKERVRLGTEWVKLNCDKRADVMDVAIGLT